MFTLMFGNSENLDIFLGIVYCGRIKYFPNVIKVALKYLRLTTIMKSWLNGMTEECHTIL